MNSPPANFLKICASAGLSPKEASDKWLEIWEKTNSQFLIWLIKEADLDEVQLGSLDKLFDDILKKKTEPKFIIELISSILDKDQYILSVKKFAQIFTENLYIFYAVQESIKEWQEIISQMKRGKYG